MPLKRVIRRAVNATAKVPVARRGYRYLCVNNRVPLKLCWPMDIDAVFTVPVDGRKFKYGAAPKDVVAKHLYWGNLSRWESETWREFVPLARRARGFLDIGAFTGAYSLVAATANPSIDCIAFEPVPAVYERLQANVAVNRFEDRITTLNAAVSLEVGTGRFYLPSRDLPDTGHLDISVRSTDWQSGEWVDVRVTTVEAVLPDDFHVDLVKIDVEDAEGPVVRSMEGLIAKHRPTIVIELLADGSYGEVVEVLNRLGYGFLHLTHDGPKRVTTPTPLSGDPCMNFLCVPEGNPPLPTTPVGRLP
jgi:FkbM family methyltransferase